MFFIGFVWLSFWVYSDFLDRDFWGVDVGNYCCCCFSYLLL